MHSRVFDLHKKEVINVRDGARLGLVGDVEIETDTAQVLALVVYGRLRLFGLLGREEDQIIPWSCIQVIGEEVVLVNVAPQPPARRHFLSLTPHQEETQRGQE